jgi:hypothetical protein
MKQENSMPRVGSIEDKDEFARAPAGYGLTLDNQRFSWGKPPRIVDPEVAYESAVASLEMPKVKREMLKVLTVGASVEALVEGYLFQAFTEGRFSPDVGLLIKAPLAFYIANIAEEAKIPYRFFENADALNEDEMDDTTFFRMMKTNSPQMFAYVQEKTNEALRKGFSDDAPEENFINMEGE